MSRNTSISLDDHVVAFLAEQAERDEIHELMLLGPNPDVEVPGK